jgi:hypothetical protein
LQNEELLIQERTLNFTLSGQLAKSLTRNMELESKLKAAYGELAKDRLEKKDWMQTRLLQIEHHFENISNEELELAKKRIQALDIEIEKLTSNEKNSAGIICSRRFGSFFRFNIHIN